MIRPFEPGQGTTIAQANSGTTASGVLPEDAAQVALYNSSATATAYWICRGGFEGDTAPTAVIPAGATRGGMPIPPATQIRISVPRGPKQYAVIASAADGTLFITPGEGD